MIAVIPWGTDAPIYHFPWATVGLIVVTTVAFIITGPADRIDFDAAEAQIAEQMQQAAADAQDPAKAGEAGAEESEEDESEPQFLVAKHLEPFVLVYGKGLHPLQWVTSNFIHANFGHLLGNMWFLWSFGIVVEGKIGWWRFLLLYLGIGVAECFTEQVLTLGSSAGVSYGASAIIYGLLAICLLWAPKNDLTCWVFIWFFLRYYLNDHEIPILWYATFCICCEAITIPLSGFAITSSLLHLFGAAWGFGFGLLMLKLDWVDCENWDLFAVLRGQHGKPKKRKRKKKKVDAEAEARGAAALQSLREAIAEGHTAAALAIYKKAEESSDLWLTPEAELLGLIKLLHNEQRFVESLPLMEQYIHRYPQKAPRVRLKLAQILIRDTQRPARALRVLAEIEPGSLPADLDQARQQLERKAQRMREEGVLELEGEV